MNKIIMGFFISVFAGCSVNYLPVSTEKINVRDEVASLKNREYYLSVEQRSWHSQPEQVNQYFSCFYITMKNRIKEELIITRDSFSLEDEEGNSSAPVLAERVSDFIISLELGSSEAGANSVSFSNPEQKIIMEDLMEARSNIYNYSFSYGNLPSQQQKEGYIFFPRLSNKNKKYTLIYNSNRFEFRKSDGKSKE